MSSKPIASKTLMIPIVFLRTIGNCHELLDEVEKLPPLDIRRLRFLTVVMKIIIGSDTVHVDVSTGLKVHLDYTMIQRSLASTLPSQPLLYL